MPQKLLIKDFQIEHEHLRPEITSPKNRRLKRLILNYKFQIKIK